MQLQTNDHLGTGKGWERTDVVNLRSRGSGGDTDVIVIPVIYGTQAVPGIVIYQGDVGLVTDATKLRIWGDQTAAYASAAWFALCAGKVELRAITANDKQLPQRAYRPATFNDGTGVYKPSFLITSERVVLVGEQLRCGSTFDRAAWTSRTMSGTVLDKLAVAYGNGLFVSVGKTTGAAAKTQVSADGGNTWTQYTNAITQDLNAVVYCGGYFFAFGNAGVIYRSEDGQTWTAQTSGVTKHLYGACTDGYRVAVVGEDGTILTTDDLGTTWTARTSGTAEDLKSVAFGNEKYMAVGTNGAVLSSGDAVTWVVGASGVTEDLRGVAYGNEMFVAVGEATAFSYPVIIMTVDNGANWTDMSANFPTGCDLDYVIFDGEQFLVSDLSWVYNTDDCVSWTWIASPTPAWHFYGGCYNPKASINDYISKLPGVAHIFFPGIEYDGLVDYRVICDSSGKLPALAFYLRKDLSGGAVSYAQLWRTSGGQNVKFLGNNPAAVIYDLLTNSQFNLGKAAADVDLASFNVVAALFNDATSRANERVYGVNLTLGKQANAKKAVDDICQHCDLVLYDDNGKFYLVSTYDPSGSVQGTLHDDDFEEFSIQRQAIGDLSNVFIGKYLDIDFNFAETTITVKNEALISAAGREIVRRVDLSYFIDRTVACVRLNEIAQRESVPRARINVTVSRKWYHLRPGNLMNIINTEYDVSSVFRVTKVTLGSIDDLRIRLDLEEANEDLYDGNYLEPESSQGNVPQKTGTTSNEGSTTIQDAKADGVTKGKATFKAADFNDNGAGLISLDETKPSIVPVLASPPAAGASMTKLYTPTGTYKINAVFSDGTEVTIYEWEP